MMDLIEIKLMHDLTNRVDEQKAEIVCMRAKLRHYTSSFVGATWLRDGICFVGGAITVGGFFWLIGVL